FFGSGAAAPALRTNRSCVGPAGTPGIIGFQSVAGESVLSSSSFRGPVRRSIVDAIERGQLSASCCRSAAVYSTRTSFSASATVAVVIGGPTGGAVPNAGGVPSTEAGVGVGWGAAAAVAAPFAAAAPTIPAAVRVRNSRRDALIRIPLKFGGD